MVSKKILVMFFLYLKSFFLVGSFKLCSLGAFIPPSLFSVCHVNRDTTKFLGFDLAF